MSDACPDCSRRAHARSAAVRKTDAGLEQGWDVFCRERGGWAAASGPGLWHAHWAAHGNATFSAVDGSMGGVFSFAVTGDEPEPIDECPICRDVAAGLWRA